MVKPSDIHTLTQFKRNSSELILRLEESGRPQVLTVDGRAKVVMLGVEAFERLTELAERAGAIAGIKSGLRDVQAGRTMPLGTFERDLRKRRRARP
jgi:prevent-host-death family protein